jgi:hypothetical protein
MHVFNSFEESYNKLNSSEGGNREFRKISADTVKEFALKSSTASFWNPLKNSLTYTSLTYSSLAARGKCSESLSNPVLKNNS